MKVFAGLPMMFEANSGQTDPRVRFLARVPGYTLFLADTEAVLSLPMASPVVASAHPGKPSRGSSLPSLEAPRPGQVIRLKFAGTKTPAAITGTDQLPGTTNYFIGNDPKKWRTNIADYEAVEYRSMFPGVDAVFHGDNRRLEFDFNVAPGADPSVIALEVQGARRIHLNRDGDVVIRMDATRDVVLGKPIVYQQSPEGRREVAGGFVLLGPNRIGFSLGSYNHSLPLVIDPTLVYSTYLGGGNIYPNTAANDSGKAIAVDSSGYVYVAGATSSSDFPVTGGAFETSFPQDVAGFVTKFDLSSSSPLVYSTCFGNANGGDTTITGIAVDAAGDAYLTGNTNYDFPTTPGAFITSENIHGSFAFATELNKSGTGLVYSTFLGGSDSTGSPTTYAYGIALDTADNAYVVGYTTSPTYPMVNAYQNSQGCTPSLCGGNGFVTKVNAGGASLAYSTYLGTGSNKVEAVAVDSSDDAIVVGSTGSTTFPVTANAYQQTSSDSVAAFVTELNPQGTNLLYSTLLSGSNSGTTDEALAVAVDASGNAYVTGQVGDSDFPTTPGAFQSHLLDHSDAFVSELNFNNSGSSSLVYSTYLPGLTTGYGIGVNSLGQAYVTGTNYGNAGTFVTTSDAFQASPPTTTTNGFLTVLDSAGSGLVYSTYIGVTSGNMFAYAYALAVDSSGNAYITGAAPPNFPTTVGAYKTTLTANANYPYPQNAFIMKFSFTGSSLTISPTILSAGTAGAPYGPDTLTATGGTGTVTFAVTTGSLPSGLLLSSSGVLSGTPTQTGPFSFTVTATDTIGDTGSQAYTLTIAAACSTITVSPSTLASGTTGAAYPAVTFTETGGVGTVTFSEMGALPTGMTFVAGVLSGTPTQTGSFRITVTATDSNSCTGSTDDTLTINTSTGPPPAAVMDNETITVTDTPTFPDIVDSETITVTDTVMVTASGGPVNTATTTTIPSTSSSFDGFPLPVNFALVGTTQVGVSFTVKPASGSATPTGSVTVTDAFNDMCSATLTSASAGAGSCALTISKVGSGTTSLTAAYAPDASAMANGLLASTSTAVTENVVQIVSCGGSAPPATIRLGSLGTSSFMVCLAGDVNAVPTAVTSNCLPYATCTLTVTPISGKAGAYNVTISISTTAASVPLQDPDQPRSAPWLMMLLALSTILSLLMAFLLARHRGGRLRLMYATGLLLALIIAGVAGCTSASTPGSSNNTGTPLGNSSINVTVSAGGFSVVVPVNVIVTK